MIVVLGNSDLTEEGQETDLENLKQGHIKLTGDRGQALAYAMMECDGVIVCKGDGFLVLKGGFAGPFDSMDLPRCAMSLLLKKGGS